MAVLEWFHSIRELFANFQAGVYPDLGTWSYVLLAVLVATEGPLSTLLGASAAAAGLLEWEWVLVATIIGNIVGDSLWYSVGYLGKMQWLYKYGRWFGVRPHHVQRLEREMRSHARKLIIFAKVAYGLIVPTLVAAGMARVPWRKWFPVVFVVETLWSILLVWIGFHTAAFIQDFRQTLHVIGLGLLVLAVLFIVMRFLRKRIDEQELALDPLQSVTPATPLLTTEAEKPVAEKTVEITLDTGTAERGASQSQVHRYVALRER